ncbi:MAG: amidohydrolase family protein, partial [Rhodospirillaceae bacterium]|nr:amidohydrolase family protein [Rhodospirillaceae bacterium]
MRFIVLTMASLCAGLWATGATADLVIKNVTLYDGTGAPARAGVSVLVKGDRIAQISAEAIKAGGAKVIDGTGKFLMPGLVEAHMHLPGGQTGNVNNPSERKLIIDKPLGLKSLHGYLYVGVTAIYDSGNSNDYIFAMRADEQAGKIVSPRIFAGGGVVTVPNGYAAGPAALKVETWEQAKRELDHRFTYKPDMIKLAIDRQGVMFQPTLPTMSQEMMNRVIKYITDNGVRTTVHIAAELDAEATINAGITALAHPVWRSIANDAFIKLAAEKKIPM